MKKRVISWLLCLALCLSMLPMAALAEDVQAPEGPAPNQGGGEAAGPRSVYERAAARAESQRKRNADPGAGGVAGADDSRESVHTADGIFHL